MLGRQKKEIILLVFGPPDRLVGWKFKTHNAAQPFLSLSLSLYL